MKTDVTEQSENDIENNSVSPWAYALMTLVGLLIATGLLFLFIFKGNELVALGFSEKVFYVLLIPLGLASGAFLFGAMRSRAVYKGKILSGALELGGPAVLSVLAVIGGFLLVPNTSPFDLTVYVHGSGGKYDLVLKNEGKVMIDLGDDRRVEGINEKGKAHFPEIPVKFWNQPVSKQNSGAKTRKLKNAALSRR